MGKTPKSQSDKSKEVPKAPRGMRDIIGDDLYAYQGFFEKCAEIATYYGFKPIETPVIEETSLYLRGTGEGTDIVTKEMYNIKARGDSQFSLRPEYTPGVMRAYIEHGMQSWPQPVMLYYFGPLFRHDKPQKGRLRELRQFGLEILGTPKSIADAMIIKMTITMLEEAGLKDLVVHINSIGDKDCRNNYKKDLVNYYKKRVADLCKDCKERLKTNPLRLLDCKEEKCQPIKENAPQAISFLCPPCKAHFKEVLEYLETLKIEYMIDNNLVRGLDYYDRTVFEITTKKKIVVVEEKKPEVQSETPETGVPATPVVEVPAEEEEKVTEAPILALAGGGRYDYLARSIGGKKDVPSVGVAIGVDRVVMAEEATRLAPRVLKKPKVYFVQLGFEAKLQSMSIIEILRKNKIPVVHALGRDKLSTQLAIAEKLQIPYVIILGQREVLDGTVIVRNMETRSQDTIKFDKLPDYVKKIK
ncbi:MAG: histidine--tRNA ligase [Candidatus Paceibacterota bacterium]|jgi:histidyl-tRNA synthetase